VSDAVDKSKVREETPIRAFALGVAPACCDPRLLSHLADPPIATAAFVFASATGAAHTPCISVVAAPRCAVVRLFVAASILTVMPRRNSVKQKSESTALPSADAAGAAAAATKKKDASATKKRGVNGGLLGGLIVCLLGCLLLLLPAPAPELTAEQQRQQLKKQQEEQQEALNGRPVDTPPAMCVVACNTLVGCGVPLPSCLPLINSTC
jgi:hypothetical protein